MGDSRGTLMSMNSRPTASWQLLQADVNFSKALSNSSPILRLDRVAKLLG